MELTIEQCAAIHDHREFFRCWYGDRLIMGLILDEKRETEKTYPLKILVVDDDVLARRLMQLLLRSDGHLVQVASNGLEAFDAIKLQRFDIVFMDLQMPVMGGIEASQRIREWENGAGHTFIVALTASYLPEEGHRLFEAGIDNYISKPFDLKHIGRMLKYVSIPLSRSSDQRAGSSAGSSPSG
jgi:two-component system, sensor histidine kinase and response regulator